MNTKKISTLKFLGARGSRPVHSTHTMIYGGNTTCLEIDTMHDFFLVIDAGTGLKNFQTSVSRRPNLKKIHLLITHTHWDHILSLPLLPQFQDPTFEISIYAPQTSNKSFEEIFQQMLQVGRLPFTWTMPRCKLNFINIDAKQSFLIEGKVKVSTFQVNHQHTTLAYKLGLPESSLAVITDTAVLNENNILGHGMYEQSNRVGVSKFVQEYNKQLLEFIRGVDALVFDTHFNEENLRMDWGHATPELALECCAKGGIKKLFMFHHAPEDDDQSVALKQEQVRHHPLTLKYAIQIINAREEDEWPIRSA
jgi:ribonuclease BN (tRNA processing enzyme)